MPVENDGTTAPVAEDTTLPVTPITPVAEGESAPMTEETPVAPTV